MRIIRLVSIVIMFTSLISCDKDNNSGDVELEISNNTNKLIELSYLTTIHNEAKTKNCKIDTSDVIITKMDFSDVAKADGSYSLHFKYENSIDTIRKDFGYYTNGSPLDSKFIIGICNDSIAIKSYPRDLSVY